MVPSSPPRRVLILGGTSEASALAEGLAGVTEIQATLSLAGRTATPIAAPIPMRVGGFGGPEGLAAYLREHAIDALIDATHPFATTIKRNAAIAAETTGVPLLAVLRPAWAPVAGDRWIAVADLAAAAKAIGPTPRRVFLTVGRKDLAPFAAAPQHRYVVRSVDAPEAAALPHEAVVVVARGPFNEAAERKLIAEHGIDVIVTKNSGGSATLAKLTVAREWGLPVILVNRPAPPPGPFVASAAEALAWLGVHSTHSLNERGV